MTSEQFNQLEWNCGDYVNFYGMELYMVGFCEEWITLSRDVCYDENIVAHVHYSVIVKVYPSKLYLHY